MKATTLPADKQVEKVNLERENARLKKELAQIQERYEFATTSFNDGIWDWNLETDEVYLSPRWKEILGYCDDELPNALTTWIDLLHPEDLNSSLDNVQRHIQDGSEMYESVFRLKHKNARWIWILARGKIFRDAGKKAIRILGSHTDITLLRKVEETLVERKCELDDIVFLCPDGIVTFNIEGKISSVNPAFLKMTGFKLDELKLLDKTQFDQKMSDICDTKHPYNGNLVEDESALIWLPIQSEQTTPDIQSQTSKFKFKNKKSQFRILRMTKHSHDFKNSPTIIYFRDVTLEIQMDQLKNEFLSVAAHELRMPISSIYGYSELLISRDFDDLTRRDILQAIHGLCTSVVELINHLLDLARIEAQCANAFEFEFLPLTQMIKETLDDFKVYGDFRKVEVHYFVDESALIYADKHELKRALINILSNAMKYSPNGQNVELEIRTRNNAQNTAQIGILIKDKGIGIAPENIPHIFNRFWRANNVSDIIGTGLGMSLVKEIADLHHAEIEVQSELGKGTTVAMWFPIKHLLENEKL